MESSALECFSYIQQEFLVCVTVHKAQNLCQLNADTYVKITLDKKSKTTTVFQNSENPFYNEYFAIELYCTLPELLHLTILFEVKKKSTIKKDVSLGELFINLSTVWNQPGHSFYKKWGKLETPMGGKLIPESRGYLQIDLTIVSRTEPPAPAVIYDGNYDDIENNLLQPESGKDGVENVQYKVVLYSGIFTKKVDYVIQVSYAGMSGKTKVQKNTSNPIWNEQITFLWFYPALSQTFIIQVMVYEMLQWKIVADYEIHFDQITYPKKLPTIGPTYINLYDCLDSKHYVGRILMAIKCEVIKGRIFNPQREMESTPATAIMEKMYWSLEQFFVECVVWQGDFIRSGGSNLKINLQCGENTSESIDCNANLNKLTNWRYFTQDTPNKAIFLKIMLPDYRYKFEPDHFLSDLVLTMRTQLENFKLFELKHFGNGYLHAKCLKALVTSFKEKLKQGKRTFQYKGFKELTDWDRNRLVFLEDLYSKLQMDFDSYKNILRSRNSHPESNVGKVIVELMMKVSEIESVLFLRAQDNWPELFINLQNSGKTVGVCKLSAANYVYAERPECKGILCGKRHNIILKPPDCKHTSRTCGCVYGKLDAWIWIGTQPDRNNQKSLNDWQQKEPFYYEIRDKTTFDCKLYIHQAKVRPGSDETGLCDAKIRVTFLHLAAETSTVLASLSPVWNEVIYFSNIRLPGFRDSYIENPPLVALEVLDVYSKDSVDYVGCGFLRLSVKPLQHSQSALPNFYEQTVDRQMILDDEENMNYNNDCYLTKFVKSQMAMQQLKELSRLSPPPLKWVPVSSDGRIYVEILMSGELSEVQYSGSDKEDTIVAKGIPPEICPINKRFRINVTFAGLRKYRKCPMIITGRYKIKVMFGELVIQSGFSDSKLNESVNFLDPYASGVVNLPEQLEYWPAIIMSHVEVSKPNKEATIGAALISKPGKYLKEEINQNLSLQETTVSIDGSDLDEEKSFEERTPLLKKPITKYPWQRRLLLFIRLANIFRSKKSNEDQGYVFNNDDDVEYNWWTKYYFSTLEEHHEDRKPKHSLVVFPSELEKLPQFGYLQDWAEPIELIQSRNKSGPPTDAFYCTLKCQIEIQRCKDLPNDGQSNQSLKSSKTCGFRSKYQRLLSLTMETKVVVQVYIVQGLNLKSKDLFSESDPFVKLQFGSDIISDRAHYISNQSSPIFGKHFQLQGAIPRDQELVISVYDRDLVVDNLIGSTSIDIEDRFKSKYSASFGIPQEYSSSGYNVWRAAKKPFDLLSEICRKHYLCPPTIAGNKISVGGVSFTDSTKIEKGEDLKERLSLSALKRLNEVPAIGYSLIPEHVETRSLYNDQRIGVEQGKLELWIEVYEAENVPVPIDITPIAPQLYELRVVIFNTKDVIFDDKNIFGTATSDIYFKVWLEDINLAQYTDVHYRSLYGEGNFNWRMIFPIRYSKIEEMMVVTRKHSIFQQSVEIKEPPILSVQLWDNDAISADDFLGTLNLNLSYCPMPSTSSKYCSLQKSSNFVDLFNTRKVKGWFPIKGITKEGIMGQTGKVEMELQILTESEASSNPAGLGRKPPNGLPEPHKRLSAGESKKSKCCIMS